MSKQTGYFNTIMLFLSEQSNRFDQKETFHGNFIAV